MAIKVTPVTNMNCLLGESPVWDQRASCLRFVDVLQSKLYSYYPSSGLTQTTVTPNMPSALAPCNDGTFIVATAEGIFTVNPETNEWILLAHPECDIHNNRYNDGKCDANGNFWIGSMHIDELKGAGSLYVIEREGKVKKILDSLTIPNGMDWDSTQQWYYHIDSETRSVTRYKYNQSGTTIAATESVINISESEGVPDGMTKDEEGMLWVAHFGGGCVCRYHPATGQLLRRIDLPASQVTSCCFGGLDYNDLYVTTAAKELTETELRGMPHSGNTFIIRNIGVRGLRCNEFG